MDSHGTSVVEKERTTFIVKNALQADVAFVPAIWLKFPLAEDSEGDDEAGNVRVTAVTLILDSYPCIQASSCRRRRTIPKV